MTDTADRGFALDRFQLEAIDAIDAGRSVLVARAHRVGQDRGGRARGRPGPGRGGRAFYTTPIKALSNQKYPDLVRLHGPERVGLLTGDNAVNGDAPVVVMTTEVLRNMIYAVAALERLRWVVLDEVHYLQDAYRGPVWEEVIVHLPAECASCACRPRCPTPTSWPTGSSTVRGPTAVVVEHDAAR